MTQLSSHELLLHFFAEECELIGNENLEPILRGEFHLIQTEHGENMPVAEFVGTVAAAVGFIDASLSLYDRFSKAPKEKGENDITKFIILARSELKIPGEIDDQRVEAILRQIAGR